MGDRMTTDVKAIESARFKQVIVCVVRGMRGDANHTFCIIPSTLTFISDFNLADRHAVFSTGFKMSYVAFLQCAVLASREEILFGSEKVLFFN